MASILVVHIPHYLIVANIILLVIIFIAGGLVILRYRRLRLWFIVTLAIGVPLIVVLSLVLRILGVDDTLAVIVGTAIGGLISQFLAWRFVGKSD